MGEVFVVQAQDLSLDSQHPVSSLGKVFVPLMLGMGWQGDGA